MPRAGDARFPTLAKRRGWAHAKRKLLHGLIGMAIEEGIKLAPGVEAAWKLLELVAEAGVEAALPETPGVSRFPESDVAMNGGSW